MLGIVYMFHHWTCGGSNDSKRLRDLTIFRISPALTQTCKNKEIPAFQADVPGYFSAIDQLPLEETASNDQAASSAQGFSERGLFVQGFRPGIISAFSDLLGLCPAMNPRGDEAPLPELHLRGILHGYNRDHWIAEGPVEIIEIKIIESGGIYREAILNSLPGQMYLNGKTHVSL